MIKLDYEKDERYFLDDPVIKKYKDYWVTKDGNKLLISKMDTDHIINCVKMLQKWAAVKKEQLILGAYKFEGTLRGELAIDCIHFEQASLEEMDEIELLTEEQPCYKTFLDVLEYRDIKIKEIKV